jgi:hypothetical protein
MKSILLTLLIALLAGTATQIRAQDTITLTGEYYSKKGVMHTVSCYGYNIGQLDITPHSKMASMKTICFDRLKNAADLEVSCTNKIVVEGYYEKVTIEGDSANGKGNCPAGTKEVFFVTKWHCME